MLTVTSPRFGVEIEIVSYDDLDDLDGIAQALADAGIRAFGESYNHSTRDYWKVTTDVSCGFEVVSPPLSWGERLNIRTVMRTLRDIGCVVNIDTGFHVHHEWPWYQHAALTETDLHVRLERVRLLYHLLQQPVLEHLLASSRWGNRYCQATTTCPSFEHMKLDRYVDVNVASLSRYSTIEFRQHQGTLNYPKALAWIELTRNIVAAASIPDAIPDRDRLAAVFEKVTTTSWRYLAANVPDLDAYVASLQPTPA